MREFQPRIVIVIEPRISGSAADRVCKNLGMKRWIRAESRGFSDRIWLMWKEGEIGVELEVAHKQFLHMKIRLGNGRRWALTAVYASPQASYWQNLWIELDALEVRGPWLLIGDFNCVLRAEERSSSSAVSSSLCSWVDRNALIDLGFAGSCFTWVHGNSIETRKAARLDRALCCNKWRRQFPGAMVRHLTQAYSDHCPVMLSLNGSNSERLGERPFRFLAA